jgi:hypothetical protein
MYADREMKVACTHNANNHDFSTYEKSENFTCKRDIGNPVAACLLQCRKVLITLLFPVANIGG